MRYHLINADTPLVADYAVVIFTFADAFEY